MICDQNNCLTNQCCHVDSDENYLSINNEFEANIRHLKCKVIDLARKQIQQQVFIIIAICYVKKKIS